MPGDGWFRITTVTDDVSLIEEPAVDRILRCNIWHVRGRDRDLLVDTGMGVASLRAAAAHVFEKPIAAVATHAHIDHVGGMHEFEERLVHRAEAERLGAGFGPMSLRSRDRGPDYVAALEAAGYEVPEEYLSAYPRPDFDVARFSVRPAPATRVVAEGDRVDLGDRSFEVLHLPGHSPGSIGLWEAATGTLFSGDAIYDGPLLDDLPGSNVADYVETMIRLRELPVRVVHGGHEPSFGRDRLVELASQYLRRVGAER